MRCVYYNDNAAGSGAADPGNGLTESKGDKAMPSSDYKQTDYALPAAAWGAVASHLRKRPHREQENFVIGYAIREVLERCGADDESPCPFHMPVYRGNLAAIKSAADELGYKGACVTWAPSAQAFMRPLWEDLVRALDHASEFLFGDAIRNLPEGSDGDREFMARLAARRQVAGTTGIYFKTS